MSDLFKFRIYIRKHSPTQMYIWFIPLDSTHNLTFSFTAFLRWLQKKKFAGSRIIIRMSPRHDVCLHLAGWFHGNRWQNETMQLTTNAHVHTRIFAFIERQIFEPEGERERERAPFETKYTISHARYFSFIQTMLCSLCFLLSVVSHITPSARVGMWRCATAVWVAFYNDAYKFPYLNYLRIHLVVSQFFSWLPLFYARSERVVFSYMRTHGAYILVALNGWVGRLMSVTVDVFCVQFDFIFPVVDVVVRQKTISSGVCITFRAHMIRWQRTA